MYDPWKPLAGGLILAGDNEVGEECGGKGTAWSLRPGMGTLPLPGRGRDASNQADRLIFTAKRFLIVSQTSSAGCLDVERHETAARTGLVGHGRPKMRAHKTAHGTVCRVTV